MDGHNEESPDTMQDVEISIPSQPKEEGEIRVNADVERYNDSQKSTLEDSSEIKAKGNDGDGTVNHENEKSLQETVKIKVASNNEDGTVDQKNDNILKENNEMKATSYNAKNTVNRENGNKINEDGAIKVIADSENSNDSHQKRNASNDEMETEGSSNIQVSNTSEQNSNWLEYISKESDNNLPPLPEEDYSSDSSSNSENLHVEIRTTDKTTKGPNVARLTNYFDKEFAAIRKKREEEAIIQSQQTYDDSDVVLNQSQDIMLGQSHDIVLDQSQDGNWNHESRTWDEVDLHHQRTTPQNFMVYKQRWAIIITLALLSFSNASLFINVAPISTKAVAYFGRPLWEINFFSIIYMIVTIPFTFISTYITKKTNIRTVMHIGAALNSLGAIIRTVAMVQSLDINMQFYLSLLGQIFCAMALSFIQYLPAKIAQSWFPESQRVQATAIGSVANTIGIVVINIIAPIIVVSPDQFPVINYVCLVPALLGETMVTFCVNRSHPPTPPSEAARQETREVKQESSDSNPISFSYGAQLRSAFCNLAYFILVQNVGGGFGIITALSTLAQQMLCTVGYSDVVSGLSIACLFLFGFVGAAVIPTYASRTGYLISIAKACWAGCSFFGLFMLMLYLIPGQAVLLCICSGMFGFFGVGSFSIGLELAVEATYPVEPAITTGFIYFWGQIQGIIVIILVSVLSLNISHSDHSVCSQNVPLQDFTPSILLLMVLLTLGTICGIVFFKTPYKRRDAERQRLNSEK